MNECPFESDAELDLFLKDFGIDVTVGSETFKGIFEDPYAAAQLGSYRIVATNPVILCKSSDVSELRHDDVLVMKGKNYRAEGVPHHDGTGIARVLLVDEDFDDEDSDSLSTVNPPTDGRYYKPNEF